MVVLVWAITGCDSPAAPEPAEDVPEPLPTLDPVLPRGSLRFGLAAEPRSIDPRFVSDDEGALVVGALFEPLVSVDERGETIPGAAQRWEVSPNGQTFTFTLREDARFHNGQRVTAEDFVRSFSRIADGTADPRSGLDYLLEPVLGAELVAVNGGELAGVVALDERTLRIQLTEPRPGFLLTLADPSLVPLPPAADGDLDAFARQPVGNGPFAMAEPWEPGGFLRLSAVDDHWRRPLLDEIVFQLYPDDPMGARQWDDLLDGQLQVASLPVERYDQAVERFGSSPDGYGGPGVLDGVTSSVYFYGFDTTTPPYDDVRVRRAISYAIDRAFLAEVVMQGSRVPAEAIVPPAVPGAQRAVCPHCRHDPAAARALLDEVNDERREAAIAALLEELETPTMPTDDPDAATEDAVGDGAPEDGDAPANGPQPLDAPADPDEITGDDPADEPTDADTGEDLGSATDEQQPPFPPGFDPEDIDVEPVLTSLTLSHSRGRTHAAIAERMAADIEAALGIEVELDARELGELIPAIHAGEVAVFRFGFQTAEPSLGAYLEPLFHSREVGRDNLTGYVDAEVDALLDEARVTVEPSTSQRLYRAAERRVLLEAPAIPLLWYRHAMVVSDDVEGLVHTAFGRIDFAVVSLDLG